LTRLHIGNATRLACIVLVSLGALLLQSCEEPAADHAEDGEAEAAKQDAAVQTPPKPKKSLGRQLVDSKSRALELEQLQALGYVDGTYDPAHEKANVLVHVASRAQSGYNFYSSRKAQGARLVDMSGRVVHEWKTTQKGAWQHSELLPNGDVLVIVKDRRLSRYDKDSKLLWSVTGRFHHDLWIHEDQLYILSRRSKVVESVHPNAKTLVDVIQMRSLDDGALQREISVLDVLLASPYRFLLPKLSDDANPKKGRSLDVLHTNHVEVFDGSLTDLHPMYSKGNILFSMRNINAIAVMEPDRETIVWIWGPTNLTFQHHPTALSNGHILLFDNGAKRSRILEIDPADDNAIVWSYAPKSGLFSATRGSNQRLSNGNTLITESDRGYVIEVTKSGRVVWKFANPVVNRKKEREAIWRMTRVDPETLTFLAP
jgi:hypothetical protein